ncbi:MAG: carbohydrate kinase [Deltaproteobacteria bacterium]|nr:carbohydrate kinase [Deltaproteobacteria bacterium]
MRRNKFLGLDLSTQSLTALVLDLSDHSLYRKSLHFDETYPSYQTRGGVLAGEDPRVVCADPRMWIEAVDDLLLLLRHEGITKEVASLSVSAQQHGSVYLHSKAAARLRDLDHRKPLAEQIGDIFARPVAPVWMDSSTSEECEEIAQAMGGDARLAEITGSRATERFTGPQIRKFWKKDPRAYEHTRHIALISSFITSLLTGRLAPVDCGDGFGTHLANIRTGKWSREALAATAPRLRSMLPRLVRGDESAGRVSPSLIKRYGFQPQTEVIVGTGDNPASLVGLGLVGDPQRKAVSLGTSDTYFGYMRSLGRDRSPEGHVFGAADGKYMLLLCFKNGSLAREAVKNRHHLSWDEFSRILLSTKPGNDGKIMLPYFLPEITPLVLNPKVHRFGGLLEQDAEGNVRAVVEGQIMSMCLHSEGFGTHPEKILVTAGGSENQGLLQTIADVFDAEVESFEVKDSAALGAALRAAKGFLATKGDFREWKALTEPFTRHRGLGIVRPRKEAVKIYRGGHGLLGVYAACEKFALGLGGDPQAAIRRFRKGYGS